jgi:hypothetical protein
MARSCFLQPLLLLTLAPALVAQSRANWDSVKQMSAGQPIRVSLTDGRNVTGALLSVTDESLTVAASKSQEALTRTMVAKVSSRGANHRLRNTLIGFGVGAGGGLIAGAVTDAETCHPNQLLGCIGGKNLGKEVFTPLGALIGGLVGALLPSGRWRTVYSLK